MVLIYKVIQWYLYKETTHLLPFIKTFLYIGKSHNVFSFV